MIKKDYGCLASIVSCDECVGKRHCNNYALIQDMICVRYTCVGCLRDITTEHTIYCPYCGLKIEEVLE